MLRKLFLVDGLAGVGKSDLLDFVERSHPRDAMVVQKFTPRSQRHPEEATNTDLKFVSEKHFAELESSDFYSYSYGGKKYGLTRSSIRDALALVENVFVIVRNRSLVERLAQDFAEHAVVVPIFVYADRNLIAERLERDGFDESSIQFRLQRSEHSWKDYLEYPDSSLRIIINNSEKTDFHRKINALIDEFASTKIDLLQHFFIRPSLRFDLIKPLMGFKADMYDQLKVSPYEKNVFVMMKFRPENLDFYAYMKSEIERAGFNCVRADAPEWNITNNVYNPLAVLYCCKLALRFSTRQSHIRPITQTSPTSWESCITRASSV